MQEGPNAEEERHGIGKVLRRQLWLHQRMPDWLCTCLSLFAYALIQLQHK